MANRWILPLPIQSATSHRLYISPASAAEASSFGMPLKTGNARPVPLACYNNIVMLDGAKQQLEVSSSYPPSAKSSRPIRSCCSEGEVKLTSYCTPALDPPVAFPFSFSCPAVSASRFSLMAWSRLAEKRRMFFSTPGTGLYLYSPAG